MNKSSATRITSKAANHKLNATRPNSPRHQTHLPHPFPVRIPSLPDQRAWNICTANQAEISDQRLRRLLAEVSSNADSGRRVQLARVQQKWTVFRDSECEWQTDAFAGGTIQPVVYSQCVIALTEERIAYLKLQLCEGGGMRGPCDASRKYDLPPRKDRARQ